MGLVVGREEKTEDKDKIKSAVANAKLCLRTDNPKSVHFN
jgi:hypothetical protein